MQYLYNISKKKFIFCMQINIKVGIIVFLGEVASHIQSTQNRKLVVFCNIFKKSISTVFVFFCDAKYSDIMWGPVMFSVTCHHIIFLDTTLRGWFKPFLSKWPKWLWRIFFIMNRPGSRFLVLLIQFWI